MIRFDRYSQGVWVEVANHDQRAAIRAAIPEGHRLHVSHGGNAYTATLFRLHDMEIVSRERAPRLVAACELALANAPETVVTVGADGWVKSIEEVR